jgi:O-antigen ligase
MPPIIALLLGLIFIGYLFWIDLKRDEESSNALWIPFLWIFFIASRYLSHWIKMAPSDYAAYHEGSPIDALVFGALLVGGIVVLSKRRLDWVGLLKNNILIWMYLTYCFISISWSDFPFVSLKRWVKEIGNPIMILVILTDKRSYDALSAIIRRIAYLCLPLSIIFFKYFPSLGRAFHPNGTMYASGVCMEKNGLGVLCLICGTIFIWDIFIRQRNTERKFDKYLAVDIVMLGMVFWLLFHADSATSLICLVVAIALMFISRTEWMKAQPSRIINFLFVTIPIVLVLEQTFDLKSVLLNLLDRDPTYTTRVPIWEFLVQLAVNDFVGSGYQSFWLGDRLKSIWEFVGRTINQAHNGYLEQYLNLGYIGVAFIVAIIVSGLIKVKKQLHVDYSAGILSLCFIVIALLYNFTEAAFYGMNNLWMLLLLSVMVVPLQEEPQEEDVKLTKVKEVESRI